MKVHRRANRIPNRVTGKFQVLCGLYLTADRITTDPDQVTCGVCIRATTSPRTISQRRLQ